jgi:hypothetical protein
MIKRKAYHIYYDNGRHLYKATFTVVPADFRIRGNTDPVPEVAEISLITLRTKFWKIEERFII